jgi:radical SAM protein with 4Fe4S-binding SPASM domain
METHEKENPRLVWLTVNHYCNLKCKWCYQREARKKTMTKELAKSLVDLSAEFRPRFIVFIGGEPTLWQHYFTLIKYIREKGVRITVVTNGLAFASHKFLEKSIRAGLTNATVSVKGSSKEEYEESTGHGRGYDAVCQAIRNLNKTSIKTLISITVSYSIMENWKKMMDFIRNCEINMFSFSFEKPVILSKNKVIFDDRMMPNRIASFVENEMYPSLISAGIDFKMEFIFPHCHYSEGFIGKVEKANHIFGGCLLLKTNGIVFDPDGFVLPCNHFAGYPLGKYGVDFKTPQELFDWKRDHKISQFYETTIKAPCRECAHCDRWIKCGSGCRLFWLYRGPKELIK